MTQPETRYVRSGNADIAYQVLGNAPLDLVYVSGYSSHVDLWWDYPPVSRYLERLASFSRLILFDRRGVGLSDPIPLDVLPTWEEWTDDVRVVMDAAKAERAAVYVERDAGPMGILFAATHPKRTSALILANASARTREADDYPGQPREAEEEIGRIIENSWGTERIAAWAMPSLANDDVYLRWAAKFARAAVTPRVALAHYRHSAEADVRSILPMIRVPTLVLHRRHWPFASIDQGRYLAEHISSAEFVELPGGDGYFFSEAADEALSHIEEFLTGKTTSTQSDRVLATVLFTDIVGSTEHAAKLGDRAWRTLLESHHEIARGELKRHRGREVEFVGDGLLATFDGPAKAIRCACAIVEAVRTLGIEIRAGLHTGEIELVGKHIHGIAVHTGARVMGAAGANEVLVSQTVKDLVAGAGIEFADRGVHVLKGVPGEWRLFLVEPRSAAA